MSRKIDLPYYDLDTMIEEKEGMPINDIFYKNGVDYFREIEHIVLYDFCSNNHNRFIMATGGGTPCFASNLVLKSLYFPCLSIHISNSATWVWKP